MDALLSWQQSLESLLGCCHVDKTLAAETPNTLDGLHRLLTGSDLSARPLHGGVSSFGIGIDAALLDMGDSGWLPVILLAGQAYILDASGQQKRALLSSDMDHVRGGFVLYRREPIKGHIFSFYRQHRKQVVCIMLSGLFINVFGLFLPLFSSFVYDKVLGNHIPETLWALATGLLFIAIIDFCIRSVRTLIVERFAIDSEANIDREVFRGLLSARQQNLPPIGRFLDRYKRLVSSRDLLTSTYLLSLVDLPFLALFALAIFVVGGPILLVPLAFGALMLIGNFITYIPAYDYDRKSRVKEEQKFKILTDLFSSHESIIGSGLRQSLMNKWQESCAGTTALQSLSRYWKAVGANIANMAAFISYASVIIAGAYMIDGKILTSGGLLAVSMLSSRMISSFSSVITLVMRYHDFRTSLSEIGSVLPAPAPSEHPRPAKALSGRISFDNVTCRLSDTASPVLSSINLRIEPGEIVGIAGIPGAGKSTLLRLIAGVTSVESGQVLIDHYPVSSLSPQDISANIAYKPQDLCLVEGSIEYNVSAGAEAMSPAERENALVLSGLGWVFQQGGLSWATEVGPRGSSLSGGQKQLVALARSMLSPKPILLLDEPTNGLDVHLESHLIQQLGSLKGRSTILISTHSRKLLSLCDRIIVVGNASILANGPRDKILAA